MWKRTLTHRQFYCFSRAENVFQDISRVFFGNFIQCQKYTWISAQLLRLNSYDHTIKMLLLNEERHAHLTHNYNISATHGPWLPCDVMNEIWILIAILWIIWSRWNKKETSYGGHSTASNNEFACWLDRQKHVRSHADTRNNQEEAQHRKKSEEADTAQERRRETM